MYSFSQITRGLLRFSYTFAAFLAHHSHLHRRSHVTGRRMAPQTIHVLVPRLWYVRSHGRQGVGVKVTGRMKVASQLTLEHRAEWTARWHRRALQAQKQDRSGSAVWSAQGPRRWCRRHQKVEKPGEQVLPRASGAHWPLTPAGGHGPEFRQQKGTVAACIVSATKFVAVCYSD